MKTWWYLCLHFTHFIIGGYWSEDLRRWSQATHQKAQCILWTCPVHSLLGRSSYQSHSPRRELWPACVWNNKVMNLTYVFPFKEEKEIEISYSHSQELPLTLVEFSPPFNINSDRNISKFYWIWKLFTFKLSEVTIINTTSFNVDSKKKNEKYNYIIRVEIPQLKTCPPPSLRVCGLCFHSFQPVSDESLKPLDCKCTQLLLCCHTKTSLWKIIRGNKRKWLVIFCLPRSYNEETAEYL